MIRTKICSIQRTDDALVAAKAGADFVGLNFVPKRHRRLEIEVAAGIAAHLRGAVPEPPRIVGLFADQPVGQTIGIIKICGLDLAQLCGQESPEYCREVREKTGADVIKVLHVSSSIESGDGGDSLETRLLQYQQAGCYITLDRLVEGLQGGTGQSFDWAVAAQLSQKGYEFLLAGGLTPDNVAQAVAQVHPWGVDVSSGVEANGQKDPAKVRAFIQHARGAEIEN